MPYVNVNIWNMDHMRHSYAFQIKAFQKCYEEYLILAGYIFWCQWKFSLHNLRSNSHHILKFILLLMHLKQFISHQNIYRSDYSQPVFFRFPHPCVVLSSLPVQANQTSLNTPDRHDRHYSRWRRQIFTLVYTYSWVFTESHLVLEYDNMSARNSIFSLSAMSHMIEILRPIMSRDW